MPVAEDQEIIIGGLQHFFAVSYQPLLLIYLAVFFFIVYNTAVLRPAVGYAYA